MYVSQLCFHLTFLGITVCLGIQNYIHNGYDESVIDSKISDH
jgi:hypothetical protein